jgi:hypothetical protein
MTYQRASTAGRIDRAPANVICGASLADADSVTMQAEDGITADGEINARAGTP